MSSTDEADEMVIDNTFSPPKKRQRKGHFDIKIKEMILNIYKVEVLDNPTMTLNDVAAKVAQRTGVRSRSVRRIVCEYKHSRRLKSPKTNQNRTKTFDSLSDVDKNAIRRNVHQFFFRNELPTVEKVLRVVNDDPDLPSFKKTTFSKILKKLNFKFGRRKRNSFLMDRNDIKCWRREYLTKIKEFRRTNRKIYYLDETWVNEGHTKSKVWTDMTVTSSRQAFLAGLSTGLKNPSGKGKRLIVCHIGSEDGFVPGGLWSFQSKKTGDYHEEMNGPSFEQWFSGILPTLPDNAVVVLDNAPYHSRKLEAIPTSASRKIVIQEWLRSKNIPFEDKMIKAQLLRLVREHKQKFTKYIIDEMAKAENKIILRLPPYHCELNPIELIWADIKNYVANKNTTFKFAALLSIFQEAVSNITPEKWKKCVEHVKQKVEPDMWKLDNIMDDVEPIVITPGESSNSSSNSSDENDSE